MRGRIRNLFSVIGKLQLSGERSGEQLAPDDRKRHQDHGKAEKK
jgi:hypothetical protein